MGENAPSQLILYHYTDLQKDKDIVLMTAEMDSKFVVSWIHLHNINKQNKAMDSMLL